MAALHRLTPQPNSVTSPYAVRLSKDQLLDVVDRTGTLRVWVTDMPYDEAASILSSVTSVQAVDGALHVQDI
jgi:hypothetical protein